MNRVTLSIKLFIWLLICALVPTLLLSVAYFNGVKSTILEQEQQHLEYLVDNKVQQIEDYMVERIRDIEFLASVSETHLLFEYLLPAYQHGPQQNEPYYQIENQYQPFFQHFQDSEQYDVFLISRTGEIFFTLVDEVDFGTNILTGPYSTSGLNAAVLEVLTTGRTAISTFSYYLPSDQYAAFIASGVVIDEQIVGFAVMQIDSAIVEAVTTLVAEPDSSREVVVVAQQGEFFSYQVALKHFSNTEVGQLLPKQRMSEPVKLALAGGHDVFIGQDYRGAEVMAVTRFIPLLGWGLVLKEDIEEALAGFQRLVKFGTMTLLGLLLLIIAVAGLLGRAVAKPLVAISQVTRKIAQGDIDLKVEPRGFRETYELAQCFNHMSARLKEARETLEHKVLARTEALKAEIGLREKKEQALADSYQELSHSMEQLQLAQDQLVESEKMASLGGLVAGVAHEINTPLGIAITSSTAVQNQINDLNVALHGNTLTRKMMISKLAEVNETLFLLGKNLDRTVKLLSSFKQMAVDQTTTNTLSNVFNLAELVDTLLMSLTPETKKYPVNIINQIPTAIMLRSFSGDFYQIFTNLILNAMIHGFEGASEGRLVISAGISERGVNISVADNGRGMDENARKKVFEPFYTTRRGRGGSGLGLSIVYNLINNKLNGTIDVVSTLGEGTEFIISCPDCLVPLSV